MRAVPGRATDPVHRRPRRLGSTRDGLLGQTVLRVATTAGTPQPPRAPVGRCWRESVDLWNDAAKFKLQFCRFLGRWSRRLRSAVYTSVSCMLGKLSRGRAARTKRSNAGPGAPQATRAVRAPSLRSRVAGSLSAWSPLLLLTWRYDVHGDSAATSGAWLALCAKVSEVRCAAVCGAKVV